MRRMHEVGDAGLTPVVVDRDDCRVVQGGDALDRGLEGSDEVGSVGELLPNEADHEVAVDPGEVGDADGAVGTGAQPYPRR